MAKAAPSDSIMAPDKMKPLLALSKREPVQAAIGLTTDGDGLILLDKKARPKKVASMLRAQAAKAKLQLNNATLRFGRAEVDADYDAGMVRFFLNKDAPGTMRAKLVEVIKRVPYQKVELNVDVSLEDEPEDDTDGATPEPPPAPSGGPDPGTLSRSLAGLMKQIPTLIAARPDAKEGLVKLATDANAALKANDLGAAETHIDRLNQLVAHALASASSTPPPAPTVPGKGTAQGNDSGPDAAELARTLGDLIRHIAAAAAANPGIKDDLITLAGKANASLKAHDLIEASTGIEALGKLLENAGATIDDVRERIANVQAQVARLPEPAKSDLEARARKALAAAAETNPAKVAAGLDALESDLAKAATAARTAEAARETGDRVSYRRLQIEWMDAQDRARRQLGQFVAVVLADKELQADPRFAEVREAMNEITDQMPNFGDKIDGALAAIDDAVDDTARKGARTAALKVLGGYTQTLEGAEGLRALQSVADEDYGGIAFFTELQSAIRSLGAQIEKAA